MTIRRAALVGAGLVALAFGLVLAFAGNPAWRVGLLFGVGMSALGGAVGLTLIALTLPRSTQAVLGAVMGAFFVRMVLVAAGALLTIRFYDGSPIAFVVGFFPLFFAFATLETLIAAGQAKRTNQAARSG